MKKLSVHLVTWNGERYFPLLFDSLKKQTFKDWELVILDNGSVDNTVAEIKKQIIDFPVEVELIEGKENLGFAKGHNKLISDFGLQPCLPAGRISDYFLLLNQDMYLEPDCLEKLVSFMDENKDCAVVSPRLMRWDFESIDSTDLENDYTDTHRAFLFGNNLEDSFTNKIDTLGLKVSRSRRVTEWMTGLEWSNKLINQLTNKPSVEVFGVSGAMPLFRKSAIDEVGLFDESFVNYKEDVDLAFRLRSAGYKAFVLLNAVAYHDRTAVGTDKMSIKNKKGQSDFVRYNSYRNHLLTLIKNEYWQNFLLDLPWVLWYELRKFVYFLLFDRKVLRGLGDIWQNKEKIKNQKSKIKNIRQANWREMRKWFV